MAKFPIDLSKFKKITTNGKNTILAHPSGHRFIVSHKALSQEQRDQLHALPFAEKAEKPTIKTVAANEPPITPALSTGMGMAKGGGVDPTQQRLMPGDKTPNKIERQVVNTAKARMADGGPTPAPSKTPTPPAQPSQDLVDQVQDPELARTVMAEPRRAFKQGGDVHADIYQPQPKPSPSPTPKEPPQDAFPSPESEMRMMATGGNPGKPIQDVDLNQLDPNGTPAQDMDPAAAAHEAVDQAALPEVSQEEVASPAPATIDPALSRKRELYNFALAHLTPDSGGNPRGVLGPKFTFGPNGEAPENLDTGAWGQAEKLYNTEQTAKANRTAAANADMAANAAARKAAGLPPLPAQVAAAQEQNEPGPGARAVNTAKVDQAAQILGGPSPDAAQGASGKSRSDILSDPYEAYKQGLGSSLAATKQIGNIEGLQAERQSNILDQAQSSYKDIQAKYTDEWNRIDGVRKELADSIQQQKIDPKQYLKSLGLAGGITNAIGLILGGIGGGLTHQGNPALDFMNKQIDRNIAMQQTELGKKENLLSATMRQFGNLHDATMMARSILSDMTANQLMEASNTANTALAKQRALDAAGQLQMKGAEGLPQMAMRRAMMSMMNQQGQSGQPKSVGDQINTMRWMNPEMAKDMEARYIKVGDQEILSTAPMPPDVKQQVVAGVDAETKMAKLEAFAQKYGNISGAMSPALTKEGQALAADAQSALRQAQHQGVYKESEAQFMGREIDPNPTKMFAKMRTLPGYKVARESNRASLKNLMNAYGAPMPNSLQRFQMSAPVRGQ